MKAYKNVIIGVLASIRINVWKGIILSMFFRCVWWLL